MDKKIEVVLITLPEFGEQRQGEVDTSIFELKGHEGTARTGLIYDLHIQRFDSELLVQGEVKAVFELECVRTLHSFTKTIEVKGLAMSIEIKDEVIDLTDQLREEIMILLPVYPVCEMGDEKMSCKIEEKYLALDKDKEIDLEESPAKSPDDRWSALDELDNLNNL